MSEAEVTKKRKRRGGLRIAQTVTARQTKSCHDSRSLSEYSKVPAAWTGWTICLPSLRAFTLRPNSSERQRGTTCFFGFSLAKV